jgi:hypothetical protein
MPWYSCIVNEVGPAADGTETSTPVIYINLTDTQGSFTGQWFFVAEGAQNQMLSVALTAMNSNRQVEVATSYVPITVVGFPNRPGQTDRLLPAGPVQYPSITRMYLSTVSAALISPVMDLNGTWNYGGNPGPIISTNGNYILIDMSAMHQDAATGSFTSRSEIVVYFPGYNNNPPANTYTGILQPPNTIQWSNNSVWTKA